MRCLPHHHLPCVSLPCAPSVIRGMVLLGCWLLLAAAMAVPTITVPGRQTIGAEGAAFFTGAAAITLANPAGGAETLQLTLVAIDGTLTLGGTTGVTLTTGDGVADPRLVMTGTPAALTAALNGLAVTPRALNYFGAARLHLLLDDRQGQTAFATVPITITPLVHGTVAAIGSNVEGQGHVGAWTEVVAIAAGGGHTVAAKANGTVVATGDNYAGQCGVGAWTNVVAVSAGAFHSVALRANGTAVAAGENIDGQSNVGAWTDVVAIAAGWNHTVAVRANGTVVATGDNNDGQCDVEAWTNVVAIAAGGFHTVGLKADGTVVATGWADLGQCAVGAWTGVRAIAAGGSHTVALQTDGRVVATGNDELAQCAVGTWAEIVAVAAGGGHTVGLQADGATVATGDNRFGQSSAGAFTETVMIAAGLEHTVALQHAGGLAITVPGRQTVAEGGAVVFTAARAITLTNRNASTAQHRLTLVAIDGTLTLARLTGLTVTTGDGVADARLVATGTLGDLAAAVDGLTFTPRAPQYSGQARVHLHLDDARGHTAVATVPITITPARSSTLLARGRDTDGQCAVGAWTDVVAVATGGGHTVAATVDGHVLAAGNDDFGQGAVGAWTEVVAVAAGAQHTVGLKRDGTVVATGDNLDAQCAVGAWSEVVAIAAGWNHTVALKANGTVVATGSNGNGQCHVSTWTDVVAIAAGEIHTVGLKADGTVVATGANWEGECNVGAWRDVVALAAGWAHTVALTADGTVVATGASGDGQCAVGAWAGVVALAAGGNLTVALRADGSLVAAGATADGQGAVSDLRLVVVVATSGAHTIIVQHAPPPVAPTALALSATTLPENAGPHALVGHLSATDPDAGDTFTYTLAAGAGDTDNAAFTITGDALHLIANADYETQSHYALRVRATDAHGLWIERAFTLTVDDLVEPNQPDLAIRVAAQGAYLADNVYNVDAAQLADTVTAGLCTFELWLENDGTTAESFTLAELPGDRTGWEVRYLDADDVDRTAAIQGAGWGLPALAPGARMALRLAVTPHAEELTGGATLTLRLQATAPGTPALTDLVSARVTCAHAPTALALSNLSVREGAGAGALVGVLSADDVDPGDVLTYTLAAGAGDADNAAVTLDGAQVRMVGDCTFATQAAYAIRVRATDAYGFWCEASFTIEIQALPEVTTPTATTITPTTATLGATIVRAGSDAITAAGIVYATTPSPTLATGTVVPTAARAGAFTLPVTGLTQVTTYYVRGFATTSVGTDYTDDLPVTTNSAQPAEVTVDNAAPTGVTFTGRWFPSAGAPGYWGTNYHYDDATQKGTTSARFTPTIPGSGWYTVALHWRTANATLAAAVPVTVAHRDGASAVTVNQQLNGGTWVPIGVYYFTAGTGGSVTLGTAGTTGYVIADAVRFSPAPPVQVTVPNGGERWLAGSAQTIRWRAYDLTGNVAVELLQDGTVAQTLAASVPATDEALAWTVPGNLSGSTYTIRVRSIDTPSAVDVSDAAFTLPPPGPTEVIVDNTEAARVTLTGRWIASATSPGFYGTNYLYDDLAQKGTTSARFTPAIPGEGWYTVALRWRNSHSSLASAVPVTVTHRDGASAVAVNQQQGGGAWVPLGIYYFTAGTNGSVLLGTTGTTGYVIADAVRFSPAPPLQVTAPNGGERWFTGSMQTIRWRAYDLTGNVTIELLRDGAAVQTLAASVAATTEALAWTVPAGLSGTTYTVRVSSLTTPAAQDASDGPCTLMASGPAEVIVDNSDATGVTLTGRWTASAAAPGYVGANYLYDDPTQRGTSSVRFTPAVPAAGMYQVFLRWRESMSTLASNVPVDIVHSAGTSTVAVNQRVGGGTWVSVGIFTFTAGTGSSVTLRTTGVNGTVIADAVRLLPATRADVVLDNAAASGVTLTGRWFASTGAPGYYGTNYLYDDPALRGTSSARFAPSLPVAATYAVYLRWRESAATLASNVPVTITHSGGTASRTLNQRVNGGGWVLLGLWDFPAGTTGAVTLGTTGVNGYVIADAVRFVQVTNEVILDNAAPTGVSFTGRWFPSTGAPGYYGTNYHYDDPTSKATSTARFTPALPAAGSYALYLRWRQSAATLSAAVPVTVAHGSGTTALTVNQQVDGGTWVYLGTFPFAAGSAGSVLLTAAGTTGYVIADAVRWCQVE
jgi:alpha-tubulin suppressor-like RCC1 family protein